ncbi:MAG: hypothetical protein CVU71_05800 [Deltaproteobacteria bacterium HGW-Deltaproteobacteria-6]|jgi:transcriptional regulator with XRE-family HTH domain|nr:MAG: hypothetical protein CVU71_05800 [Deltaproteobacteria bacterium HGW-Deltaproteobacteria-6]
MTENRDRLRDGIHEAALETGLTKGMELNEILDDYLEKRNDVLTILRIYSNKSLSEVSKELGITERELEKIENSDDHVPFQLVPKLAKIYKVDLKMLLTSLGHVMENANKASDTSYELGLAAQYSGPELKTKEKIDLEQLFKKIIETANGKKLKR